MINGKRKKSLPLGKYWRKKGVSFYVTDDRVAHRRDTVLVRLSNDINLYICFTAFSTPCEVPQGVIEENQIQYRFCVYDKQC